MHSSQNEQDSRYYADFGRTICFEPADQQEAYEMTREAFELSERFHRAGGAAARHAARAQPSGRQPRRAGRGEAPAEELTRAGLDPAAESRAAAVARPARPGERAGGGDRGVAVQHALAQKNDGGLGVITTGLARNYYRENVGDMPARPSHLHIGAYPFPKQKIRELAEHCDRILVLEEGYPGTSRGCSAAF
jgi:indolepyruvate ferredoxin oxidoreductase alpha subunit